MVFLLASVTKWSMEREGRERSLCFTLSLLFLRPGVGSVMVASWSPAMYWKDCWSLEWQDSGLRRQGRETGSVLNGGVVEDLSQRELRLFMECGTSLAKQRKAKVNKRKHRRDKTHEKQKTTSQT